MAFLRGSGVLAVVLLGSALSASGCGSDDDKKSRRADAGAGGIDDGPTSGGSEAEPGGAPSTTPVGHGGAGAGGEGEGEAPVELGGAGGAQGTAGAPALPACEVAGTVTGLSINPEPIYQGCRGAVVKVPFDAEDATAAFACCGVSTSEPEFGAQVQGAFSGETGTLVFTVPSDAPLGTYALAMICPTDPTERSFAIEVNDAGAPEVLSVSAEITPAGAMVVTGKNLQNAKIGAVRASGEGYWECLVADSSDTSVTCNFNGDIPISQDQDDSYFIDVYTEECGFAPNPPQFLVVAPID
jgi:hypothetical protein